MYSVHLSIMLCFGYRKAVFFGIRIWVWVWLKIVWLFFFVCHFIMLCASKWVLHTGIMLQEQDIFMLMGDGIYFYCFLSNFIFPSYTKILLMWFLFLFFFSALMLGLWVCFYGGLQNMFKLISFYFFLPILDLKGVFQFNCVRAFLLCQ